MSTASFTVANNILILPEELPLAPYDAATPGRLDNLTKCSLEFGSGILSDEDIFAIEEFSIFFHQRSLGKFGSDPFSDSEKSLLEEKYQATKPLLQKFQDAGVGKNCPDLGYTEKNDYHDSAPQFCREVFPTFEANELEQFLGTIPNDHNVFSHCEGREAIGIRGRELVDSIDQIRNFQLEDRKYQIDKKLKALALEKLDKKRAVLFELTTASPEDPDLNSCLARSDSPQFVASSRTPMPKEDELRKLIATETMNAFLLRAAYSLDREVKYREANDLFLENRKNVCERKFGEYQGAILEGREPVETTCEGVSFASLDEVTFRQAINQAIEQEANDLREQTAELVGGTINGLLDNSTYLFDLDRNYTQANGKKILNPSPLALALSEKIDPRGDELVKKMSDEIAAGEFDPQSFFADHADYFGELIHKNMNDTDRFQSIKKGIQEYRDDLTESMAEICVNDEPELHFTQESWQDFLSASPDIRSNPTALLEAQMAWCSLHRDHPPEASGMSLVSKFGLAGMIIGLPFLAVPGVGLAALTIAGAVMTVGTVTDYAEAETAQDISRGSYLAGYQSLKQLQNQNEAVRQAEIMLGLEVALLPLAVADVAAITKAIRRSRMAKRNAIAAAENARVPRDTRGFVDPDLRPGVIYDNSDPRGFEGAYARTIGPEDDQYYLARRNTDKPLQPEEFFELQRDYRARMLRNEPIEEFVSAFGEGRRADIQASPFVKNGPSGDLTYVQRNGDNINIALLDGTGHGIEPAFMSDFLHQQMRTDEYQKLLNDGASTDELMSFLEDRWGEIELLKKPIKDRSLRYFRDFVDSAGFAEGGIFNYNTQTRVLSGMPAARNPVYIRRADGTFTTMESIAHHETGAPLMGLGAPRDESLNLSVELQEGDQVFMMLDGFTEGRYIEGRGPRGSGIEDMLDFLNTLPPNLSPAEVNQELIRRLEPPIDDDATIIGFDA